MLKKISLVVACLAILFVTFGARADEWNKKTILTFSQPVELPGIVLPAGTYVFKLVDLPSTRNVVQVFNAEENHVYATILAIPHLHATPHEKPYIGFEERPAGTPMAIHEWFYPGHVSGLEFVFPKVRAVQLARESGQPVLAAEVRPAETPAELQNEPVVEVTPENREIRVAETFEPILPLHSRTGSSEIATVAHSPAPSDTLPGTASPLPMIALAGIFCLALAGTIKALTMIREDR